MIGTIAVEEVVDMRVAEAVAGTAVEAVVGTEDNILFAERTQERLDMPGWDWWQVQASDLALAAQTLCRQSCDDHPASPQPMPPNGTPLQDVELQD